jgi:hypothetical protein|tara:strand:- start:12 stop:1712 length:1701 start_codon:yes stop_codon:yes gene_type:complete
MDFSLYYRKTKNRELFKTLENSDIQLSNLQNYIPIYEKFFSLNNSNYNSINLNHKYHLHDVNNCLTKNILTVKVSDISNNLFDKTIFCKFSPLLDPLKYMTGKYDISNNSLFKLPDYQDTNCFPKLLDHNNTSYVDGFFTYLSSQLNNNYGFVHGVDYYGSFLCNQKEFMYNIVDDIDYLNESNYFHEKKNTLFKLESDEYADIFNIDSRRNKKKIKITEPINNIDIDNLEDVNFDLLPVDDISSSDNTMLLDLNEACIFNTILDKTSRSSSTCSSKSSNTTVDENDDCELNEIDVGSYQGDSDSESESDEQDIFCSIYDFPVEMICLEKCENTLDVLMEAELLNNSEWTSCLFQIIMILTIYQKTFSFTHNDLHTNNIMYIPTEKKSIYYCYDGTYYKVPTFGKIYKIIDFGRAIYKFNGKTMCSDSFHPKGDAASQYNCEPYFDEKKPRLDPNTSFDLCRLSCCLFDNFVDDLEELPQLIKKNKIVALLHQWLLDDKKRNVLYKNNGDERYPEFKLYKMIARTVHNAIPCEQIQNDIFKTYITSKKKINKNNKIIHFDKIPNLQ